jgi:aconitase A
MHFLIALQVEIAYYTHGGILPYVIRKIAAEQ